MLGCSIPALQVSWGWGCRAALLPGAPGQCVRWVLTAHTPPRPPGKGGCDPAAPSLSPGNRTQGLARGQTPALGIHLWLLLGDTPMQPPMPSWPDQVPKPLPTHTLSQDSPTGQQGLLAGWRSLLHWQLPPRHCPPASDQVREKAEVLGTPEGVPGEKGKGWKSSGAPTSVPKALGLQG